MFYSKVLMIRSKAEVKEGPNSPNSKESYSFQGQSARYKHWLNLHLDWIEDNFITRQPELYKRLCQHNVEGQYVKTLPTFPVTIRNSNETGEM